MRKKLTRIILATSLTLLFTACGGDSLTDSRDGKIYRTVKIGEQEWMAENLNLEIASSKCYKNNEENCEKYGRLYTWAAAMDSSAMYSKDGARCGNKKECDAIGTIRGICPEGWHLPRKEEFETMIELVKAKQFSDAMQQGGKISPHTALKSSKDWNGTDDFDFSAVPAGAYDSDNGSFTGIGNGTFFWSSTEKNKKFAHILALGKNATVAGEYKGYGFSIRCLKNND